MSNKNPSLNKANWKKLDELMKQTNKSTRQAAVAEVLDKAGKCDLAVMETERITAIAKKEYKKLHEAYEDYFYKCDALSESLTLYRISFVVLTVVAIAGWVL